MATHYVRPATSSHTQGDTTTYAGAYKGLSALNAAALSPDDIVYVAGYYYSPEQLALTSSGTDGHPIVVKSCTVANGASEDDPGVLHQGQFKDTSGWSESGGIYSTSWGYANSGFLIEVTSRTVLEEVDSLVACQATAGSVYVDTDADILYYHPSGSRDDLSSYFIGANSGCASLQNSDYVTLDGLTFVGSNFSRDDVIPSACVNIYRGTSTTDYGQAVGITIQNCTIGWTPSIGVIACGCITSPSIPSGGWKPLDGLLVQNCDFVDCTAGVYLFSQCANVTIQNNTFTHTSNVLKRYPYFSSPGDACAIAVQGLATPLLVQGNTISNWHGEGIYLYLQPYMDQSIYPSAGWPWLDVVGRGESFLFTIDGNTIDMNDELSVESNLGIGVGGTQGKGSTQYFGHYFQGSVISNNIVKGCSLSGTGVINGGGIFIKTNAPYLGGDPISIVNNTLYDCYESTRIIPCVTTPVQSVPLIFKNNIIAAVQSGGYFQHWPYNFDDTTDVPDVDYNCYHGAGNYQWDAGTVRSTIADWRTDSGQDANSTTADPLFTDAANDDFTLTAASVAVIDKGTDTGLSTDYLGNPRPYGAGYDIGAYEFFIPAIIVPVSDVSAGGWIAQPPGSLYAAIDEGAAAGSTADYIYSSLPTSTFVVSLAPMADPSATGGMAIRWSGRGNYILILEDASTSPATGIWTYTVADVATTEHIAYPSATALASIADWGQLQIKGISGGGT